MFENAWKCLVNTFSCLRIRRVVYPKEYSWEFYDTIFFLCNLKKKKKTNISYIN